jgi:hypothetical protein
MTTLEKKIQKKVDEINKLISLASNSDSDNAYDGNLMVTDTSSTWEEPAIYKPIVFRNGVLYIEYFEPYSNRTKKDKILKRNLEFDGYGTLLDIAKIYRRALKKENIKYAGGGNVEEYKPYIFYFYNENGDEVIFKTLKQALYEAEKQGFNKVRDNLGGEYFLNFENGGEFMTDPTFGNFQNNVYADGGVTNNYVPRRNLNTITIKKGNQKLTYKISDVLNGAYKLESGASIDDIAFYVPKRSVVKVQLKSGKDFKPANGYWIKDSAKPIHVTKFDEGGSIYNLSREEFMKKEIDSQKEKEKSITFKKYKVNVFEEGYPFVEPLMTNNFIEAINFAKKTIESQRGYRSTSKDLFAEIDKFQPIEKRSNVRYPYSSFASFSEEDLKTSKFYEGGVMSRLLTRKKDQPKVETINEDIDLKEDSRIRVKSSSFVRKDKEGDWMMKKNSSKEARAYAGGGLTNAGYFKNEYDNDYISEINKYFNKWNNIKTEKDSENFKNIKPPMFGTYQETDILEQIKHFEKIGMPFQANEVIRNQFKKEVAKIIEKWLNTKSYSGGGKTTFSEKAKAIAKKFEGNRVEPKYQKEYGKVYDKKEAKEVGNKIAGSQKAKYDAKYDAKAEKGAEVLKGKGNHKMKATTDLARKIRKDGEKWTDAIKRASQQLK